MSASKIHKLGIVKMHWLLHLGNERNLVIDEEADKQREKYWFTFPTTTNKKY